MTNREKLREIAGRLGADADLAMVRAALLALIRVLLGIDAAWPRPSFGGALTIESIKKMILGSFSVCQSGGDLIEPCTPDELFLSAQMKLVPMCREALDQLVAEGKVTRSETTAANGASFYELTKLGMGREPPQQRGSAIEDIQSERRAMVVESIDRGATTYEKTRSELAGKGIHMAPIGGWPHQREDEP